MKRAQICREGDTVLVERGIKIITTTILRVDYHEEMEKFYYYTKAFGPNMGLPKTQILSVETK